MLVVKNHRTIPHSQLTGEPVALPETNSQRHLFSGANLLREGNCMVP